MVVYKGTASDLKIVERRVKEREKLERIKPAMEAIRRLEPAEQAIAQRAENAVAQLMADAIENAVRRLPPGANVEAIIEEVRRTYFPDAAPITLADEPDR
jgi:hypothetical protein